MSKAPKLRFKEFSGDWEEKKLGELGEFKNGINKSKEDFGYGYPFVNLMDVFGKNSIQESKFELVNATKKELMESNLVKGDVLFVRSSVKPSGVGLTAVVLDDLKNTVYSGFLIRFRDNNNLDLNFKKYCFYNPKFRNKLMSKSSTSANTNINQESLKVLNIKIPDLKEQEKIASFLSLIDDKISLQGEKVEVLKDYKNGMMQKIFSRELRFKDDEGRDYPEWEEKKLESIVIKKKKGKNAVYAESGNILLNNEYMENNTEPMYVENEIDVNEKDILILWDGSQAGKMYTGFTGVLGSTFVAITLDKHNCNRFIHQQLMYNLDKIQLAWREGSGVPHVAKDFIENFKIKVPKLEEQRKISKLLEGIDSKIEKEQEKLNSLNEYKKGLLQQMFV